MQATTNQAAVFSNLFRAMSNIVNEFVIHVSSTGMHISTWNKQKTSLLQVDLDASKFTSFVCDQPLKLGFDGRAIYNTFAMGRSDDIIEFTVDSDTPHTFVIKNVSRGIVTRIRLVDINQCEMRAPTVNITATFDCKSSKVIDAVNVFHKFDNVTLTTGDDSIVFSGDDAYRNITATLPCSVTNFCKDEAKFAVDDWRNVLRFLQLSGQVQLGFINNGIFVISMDAGSLGSVKIYMTSLVIEKPPVDPLTLDIKNLAVSRGNVSYIISNSIFSIHDSLSLSNVTKLEAIRNAIDCSDYSSVKLHLGDHIRHVGDGVFRVVYPGVVVKCDMTGAHLLPSITEIINYIHKYNAKCMATSELSALQSRLAELQAQI